MEEMSLERAIFILKHAMGLGMKNHIAIEKVLNELDKRIPIERIEEMRKELNEEFERNNSQNKYGVDYYLESEKYGFVDDVLKELLNKE